MCELWDVLCFNFCKKLALKLSIWMVPQLFHGAILFNSISPAEKNKLCFSKKEIVTFFFISAIIQFPLLAAPVHSWRMAGSNIWQHWENVQKKSADGNKQINNRKIQQSGRINKAGKCLVSRASHSKQNQVSAHILVELFSHQAEHINLQGCTEFNISCKHKHLLLKPPYFLCWWFPKLELPKTKQVNYGNFSCFQNLIISAWQGKNKQKKTYKNHQNISM